MKVLAKQWIFLAEILLVLSCSLNFVSAYPYQRTLVPTPTFSNPSRSRILANSAFACRTVDNLGGPLTGSRITSRNGVTDTANRWTRFHVLPDKAFNNEELAIVKKSIQTLSDHVHHSCLDIRLLDKEAKPTGDYVKLVKGKFKTGCFTLYVGRWGIGEHIINLEPPGCMTFDNVIHELLHALGFFHEHNRHDRDDHITVFWENIQTENIGLFTKLNDTSFFGISYNPNSIMHYHSYDFTKYVQPVLKPTMLTKNGSEIWGRNAGLQQTDIDKLKAMYNCASQTSQKRNQDFYDDDDEGAHELIPDYNEEMFLNQDRLGYYDQEATNSIKFNEEFDTDVEPDIEQRTHMDQYELTSQANEYGQIENYDINQDRDFSTEQFSGGINGERPRMTSSLGTTHKNHNSVDGNEFVHPYQDSYSDVNNDNVHGNSLNSNNDMVELDPSVITDDYSRGHIGDTDNISTADFSDDNLEFDKSSNTFTNYEPHDHANIDELAVESNADLFNHVYFYE